MKRLFVVTLLLAGGAHAQEADAGPVPPDAGLTAPDAASAAPDAGSPAPDARSAAPDAGTRRRPPGPDADLATKDVHVASIHLQVARLYVTGLYDLSGKPTTWDRERGITLFTQAQNAAADADRTLAELSGLAKGEWAKAAEPVAKARATLARVQTQLRSLAVPVRGAGGQGVNGQKVLADIYKSLDSAKDDLESAAKTMKVETKLRTP